MIDPIRPPKDVLDLIVALKSITVRAANEGEREFRQIELIARWFMARTRSATPGSHQHGPMYGVYRGQIFEEDDAIARVDDLLRSLDPGILAFGAVFAPLAITAGWEVTLSYRWIYRDKVVARIRDERPSEVDDLMVGI